MTDITVKLPTLHEGQIRAYRATQPSERQLGIDPAFAANAGGKRKAVRCGRRWGKTDLIKTWIGDGAIKKWPCAIFAPDYKRMSEVYAELAAMLAPVTPRQNGANKTDGVIRLITGGRIDFWTLGDENAGRSRKYKRVAIDESAFTEPNMMEIWEKSIEPTLLDYRGDCLTASNTNGIDPENFLWQVCNQAKHGFIELHEPSWNNPFVPERLPDRTDTENVADRLAHYELIRSRKPPLVFAQEYEAEFVDWSGVGFFDIDKLLRDGQPVEYPTDCDSVYAVIDTATKTGSANDATGVTYFARSRHGIEPLIILDWDAVQIEGALLETWLPTVLQNLEALAARCRARFGSAGAFIEDAASGQVLLQQAARRGLAAAKLPSALTAMGKDERAISISGYVYQGKCKISREAYVKNTTLKGVNRNHFVSQVTGFHIGDKDAAKRADDLLDTFTYGVAIGLGNNEGH